ncbi:hypothetical protein [Streptomyces sp. NBC_01363]|uniref:hypothetical protein n=1 Tax=Streptomyces sp. NBC_01363 TaxID=2903840 RepID=UPI00225A8B0C|nr:hypothetical protein [Streptomyces sp. NBC_01363]MCX4732729.1 hypothetical protein [Streptomyces sp. NBC_01363]
MVQDDVVGADYAQLKTAALRLLDVVSDLENPSQQVDVAIRNLRALLSNDTLQQSGEKCGGPDPFEHALAARRYADQQAQPISLSQRAAELRHRLDGDRDLDKRQRGEPSRNVVITELRAMIVAGLLEELAARLSPGAAFGPGRSGEELAHLAADLAKELLDRTFVGE